MKPKAFLEALIQYYLWAEKGYRRGVACLNNVVLSPNVWQV